MPEPFSNKWDILDVLGPLLGSVSDAEVIDPTASASQIALLKGILATLGAQQNRRGTLDDHSGTITAGGAAQQVVPADTKRTYLLIQNVSTGTLWIDLGVDAVEDQPSIPLDPGASFTMEQTVVSTQSVSIIGATTGQAYTCKTSSGTAERQGTLTDHSGTLTEAGTAQQVTAANANRNYLLVQNVSTGDLWFNYGANATQDQPSIRLSAGASMTFEGQFVSTDSVSVIGATAGQAFVCKEG